MVTASAARSFPHPFGPQASQLALPQTRSDLRGLGIVSAERDAKIRVSSASLLVTCQRNALADQSDSTTAILLA